MPESNQPQALKFSLSETVLFRKGDEIDELISLSLEPNVTIQDLDHFISIRGSLDMYGEYKKDEEELEDITETPAFSGQKYATVLETRESGICEFSYEFPVDITIPKTRIQDLGELDLTIDMFDYQLLASDRLKIETDITITGIYDNFTQYEERDSVEEETPADSPVTSESDFEETIKPVYDGQENREENGETVFFAEASKTAPEPEQEEHHVPIHIMEKHEPEEPFIDPEDLGAVSEGRKDGDDSDGNLEDASSGSDWINIKTPELNGGRLGSNLAAASINEAEDEEDAPFEEEYWPSSSPNDAEEKHGTEPSYETEPFVDFRKEEDDEELYTAAGNKYENIEEVERTEPTGLDGTDSILDDPENTRTEKSIHYQSQAPQAEKEKPISLTEYFARKEEEERSTKMKMYFVQKEESLNDIAEKYDVLVSQLVRVNHLEDHQDLYEGQILYIPVKSKSTIHQS